MTESVNKLLCIVVVFFITTQCSFCQAGGDKTNMPDDILFTEELFIHTDRDIYIAGETVFLKIFKLKGITRTPGNISQVVYIELLDTSNNPVTRMKIGVNSYSASGEFMLPGTLPTGNYLIRSCTRWMQNFSSDLFSYKRITVINPFGDVSMIKLPVPDRLPDSIAFYPESGSLVSGIESVVGFRCFDTNGDPAFVRGIVKDSKNDTLYLVKTDQRGYGFFSVKPSDNSKIYLVAGAGGNKKSFQLPVVKDSGIVFTVNPDYGKDAFKIEIVRYGNFKNEKDRLILLYSPVSGEPIRKEITLETAAEVNLEKEILPAGLASIMITDDQGHLLANRWVYNKKKEDINFRIQLKNKTFSTRERVSIDITATDDDGNPVGSDMVISVVKSFSLDKKNIGNLPGYLQFPLLSSMETFADEYDVNDYLIFYSNEAGLQLTDKHMPDGIYSYLPELRGHLVSGKVRDATTGEPLANEHIVLSFVGKKARCRFSKTDSNGCFNFEVREYGTREVVIQPLSNDLNASYVELDNPFPETVNRYKSFPFYPDTSKLADINKAIISMQVQSIYEPFLGPPVIRPAFVEPDFYGEPDDTIILSRFIELNSLNEIIKEIVPGVIIYKRNGKSKLKINRSTLTLPFSADPMMLVDGVPVKDLDLILTIDPQDLDRIEILRERYLISDIVIEGIIHFITKKGNLSLLESDNPVFRQEFQAFQKVNSSAWPDYSKEIIKNNRIPDFRNTLYWNPGLSTGESGKAAVEFYTSDEPGEYTIIVTGMTSDGRSCRSETHFQVKEMKIR